MPEGLKENVIIGKAIPAGSGMQVYRDYNLVNTPESPVTQDMIDTSLTHYAGVPAAAFFETGAIDEIDEVPRKIYPYIQNYMHKTVDGRGYFWYNLFVWQRHECAKKRKEAAPC